MTVAVVIFLFDEIEERKLRRYSDERSNARSQKNTIEQLSHFIQKKKRKDIFPAVNDIPNLLKSRQAKHAPISGAKPSFSLMAKTASPTFSAIGGPWTDKGDVPTGQLNFVEWVKVSISCSTAAAKIYYTLDTSIPDQSSTLYTGPVTLQKLGFNSLNAIAYASGLAPSPIAASPVYNILEHTPMPVITGTPVVSNGVITVSVTIQAVHGANVYYTVDGSDPVCHGSMGYEKPYVISTLGTTVVKAKAWQSVFTPPPAGFEYSCSQASNATFTVSNQVAFPVIQPAAGGSFVGTTAPITMSSTTFGAQIHYTVDGTDPTAASPLYPAGGLTLGLDDFAQNPFTVKAVAVVASVMDSAVVSSGPFVVVPPAPTILFPPGPYVDQVAVTVQSSRSDAAIFYTLDGTTPTQQSSQYTGPVLVTTKWAVVKAVASLANKGVGAVAVAGPFDIRAAAPTLAMSAGPFINSGTVYLQSSDTQPIIYYTTDGSSPVSAGLEYNPVEGITVSATNVTLKAYSKAAGLGPSDVLSAQIRVQASPPQIQPNGGAFVNQVAPPPPRRTHEAMRRPPRTRRVACGPRQAAEVACRLRRR